MADASAPSILLGIGERLSVPLPWGGTRRAALEFERTFKRGPLTRDHIQRRNLAAREPAVRDRRSPRRGEGTRRAPVRPDSSASERRRHAARSGSATWTTGSGRLARPPRSTRAATPPFQRTPSMPAAAGRRSTSGVWSGSTATRADGRGYLRLIGQSVLAGTRAVLDDATRHCPPTSGCSSAARRRCADSGRARSTATACWSASAELRVPLTSVISGRKARCGGIHRCGEGRRLRHGPRECRVAARRRRGTIPDRTAGEDQPRHRTQP